jgi:hypothetical protein
MLAPFAQAVFSDALPHSTPAAEEHSEERQQYRGFKAYSDLVSQHSSWSIQMDCLVQPCGRHEGVNDRDAFAASELSHIFPKIFSESPL